MKLTQKTVATLRLPVGKAEAIYFDEELPLGVRLRAGGAARWIYQYKLGAKNRRITLGALAALSAAEARKVADAQIERVKEESESERQRRLEETKRQIDAETKRSLDMIRSEVADLTLEATARVTGKVLDL